MRRAGFKGSLKLRLLAGAGVWITLALVVAGLAISWLLRDQLQRGFDARLESVAVGMLAELETDPQSGAILLERSPVEANYNRVASGWYWQISDNEGVLLRSRSLWNEELAVPPPQEAGTRAVLLLPGPQDTLLRALVMDVTAPGGGGVLRVVTAGPQGVIDDEIEDVETTLFLALFILGAGLVAAVLLQTLIGLKPLADLQRDLAKVRHGERERLPERSFAEVAPLVGEVNALLDQNAIVIERARTHAANLAHGLKTPLSALSAEAARPGRDPDGSIERTVQSMERLIRHHLSRARVAGSGGLLGARVPLAPVVDDLMLALTRIHVERSVRARLNIAPGAVFLGERQDLEEMLGNLLDNAFKWARSTVSIEGRSEAGRLIVSIADDGPGLSQDEHEDALRRGHRLDTSVPGDGFGLAIARDLSALHGGELTLSRSMLGGLEVRLDLPGEGARQSGSV